MEGVMTRLEKFGRYGRGSSPQWYVEEGRDRPALLRSEDRPEALG